MLQKYANSAVIFVVVSVLGALGLVSSASAATAKTSGTPIKVGVIYTVSPGLNFSEPLEGAQAAAKYLNRTTGLNGHPVEIVGCDDKGDPAANTACGKAFVDAGVLAVAGSSGLWGSNGLAAMPNIPFIGSPVTGAEFLGPNSYPNFGGALAVFPALVKYSLSQKIKSASIIYSNLAVGKSSADALIGNPLTAAGVKVTGAPLDVGAADVTPAVVQANQSHPDVIFMVLGNDDITRVLKAASQVGVTAKLFGVEPSVGIIDGVPGNIVKQTYFSVTTDFFDKKSKDAALYTTAMKASTKDPHISATTASNFANVMTLQTIVKPMTSITADGVLNAIKTAAGIPVFMGQPLDSANPAKLGTASTHVFNASARIVQFNSRGKLVDANKNQWVNGAVTTP